MLVSLLKFEWYYHTRHYLLYVTLAVFLALGFSFGASNGMSFPNVNKNSPFELTYLIGLLSMAAVFSITVNVAQSALRETDHQFHEVIAATPAGRGTYLFSRVAGLSAITLLSLVLAAAGLLLAHRFTWAPADRNAMSLSLTGNFLFNRVLWVSVSLVLFVFSGRRFSFTRHASRPGKPEVNAVPEAGRYQPAVTTVAGIRYSAATIFSSLRLDMVSVFKGIPFVLILVMMTVLLIIECTNAVNGNTGTGELYGTSALMFSTILEVVPFFALLVILFYSSEVAWRSRDRRIDSIEATTPAAHRDIFVAKLLTLALLALILVAVSCLVGILMQLTRGVPEIEWNTYGLLFYFLYEPLVVAAVVMLCIQYAIRNKYLGLLAATVIALLCGTGLGKSAGITHPLLRFSNPVPVSFSDMNGFGAYATAFHWQAVYWLAVACLLVFFRGGVRSTRFRNLPGGAFLGCIMVLLVSGGYVISRHDFRYPTPSREALNDWKQAYEERFKQYERRDQPTITDVQTTISLYPDRQAYDVQGEYQLVNRSGGNLDSLLIHISREVELKSIRILRPAAIRAEARYGHYWFRLKKPLRPGDTTRMKFSFRSHWSPFRGHTAFNSIIGNGTFIRMSNYFPSFGYESGNEITNSIERQKRGMPPQTPLKRLEEPEEDPYNYHFIRFSAVVSTSGDQTVIGPGNLVGRWTRGDRNYFHYRSGMPIPFRFAFSSARYRKRTAAYKNIPIEVYFDERHSINVAGLIRDAKTTLEYCETNFGKYPHRVVRFAEISAFAEGFAATAYPGTIFMKENGGFHNNVSRGDQHDVINALAGHELSHQWWGTARLDPAYKEGGWLLTETLAKYTELMLYEKSHGKEALSELIRYHVDTYLSLRSYSRETPLVKTTFETPHLPYNKGFVAMYQLKELIGEKAVNEALRSLLARHGFPNPPADAEDLLQELYRVAPKHVHPVIDELFRKIILFDGRIIRAAYRIVSGGHEVVFDGTMQKFQEDGLGNRRYLGYAGAVLVGVYDVQGRLHVRSFPVRQGRVSGRILLPEKPRRIVMDPTFKHIDAFPADNERVVEVAVRR